MRVLHMLSFVHDTLSTRSKQGLRMRRRHVFLVQYPAVSKAGLSLDEGTYIEKVTHIINIQIVIIIRIILF